MSTIEGWTTVGPKQRNFQSLKTHVSRPGRWCKHGNSCIWKNCKFRHERCAHYDSWVARRCTGKTCRSHDADPESCKSTEEGGCQYDHRNPDTLRYYVDTVPATTEKDLMEEFYRFGLDQINPTIFDITNMEKFDKKLLMRSLSASPVEFEGDEDTPWLRIVTAE